MGITTNIDKIVADVKKQTRKINKAEVKALNKAGRDTHPEAKRQLRSRFNVKASAINKAKKRPRRATSTRKAYNLEYQASRLNVKDYGVRQNRKGITWQVEKGARTSMPHGFKVGHNSPRKATKIDRFGMIRTGIFKNVPGKRKPMIKRETIKSVTGPSVPQLLRTKNVDKKIQSFFRKKFKTVLNRLMR